MLLIFLISRFLSISIYSGLIYLGVVPTSSNCFELIIYAQPLQNPLV